MSHLTAICNALDFVEAHLTQDITVADMAAAASYSLYHFSRTFNRVVHHTPYDYLMRRRLSESAQELVETDKKIIQIALDYQFNNPETYSRAFKRVFGVQPSQWREQEGLDQRLLMPRLTSDYIEHVNRGDYLKPVLKERGALDVVGVMTLVEAGQETVSHLWEILAQEIGRVVGTYDAGGHYGIAWYPEGWQARGFLYMAAVETGSLDVAGSALVTKRIPPLKYACFIHKGTRKELRLTLDYIYQTWLPKSGERLAHPLEIEYYGAGRDPFQDGGAESAWKVCIPIE